MRIDITSKGVSISAIQSSLGYKKGNFIKRCHRITPVTWSKDGYLSVETAFEVLSLFTHQVSYKGDYLEYFTPNPSSVYFIVDETYSFTKIGQTQNILKRFFDIQTSNPYRLSVLFVMNSPSVSEKSLHSKFSDIRKNGEWFFLTKKVVEFVKSNSSMDYYNLLYKKHLRKFYET